MMNNGAIRSPIRKTAVSHRGSMRSDMPKTLGLFRP
jgi:hypothetical protein